MKNKLDQHIDDKLKTSFDSFQKEAPEHLWEQVSEGMNAEDALNTSLDEKVQVGHLNIPAQKAPASIWKSIENGLDEISPIDTALDAKIKDGFLSDSKAAPAFLWGAISNELSTPPATADTILDDKLKEGFLAQETKKTPNKVWYVVSRQLNIDKTWERISKVLDKEPIVSDWSGRMLRFLAGAALLLLLLKTCTHEPYTLLNPNLVQQVNNNKTSISKPENGVDTESQKQEPLKEQNSNSNSLESLNSNTSEAKNKNLIGVLPTSRPKQSSKKGKVEITKGKPSIIVPLVDGDIIYNNNTAISKEKPTIIAAAVPTESENKNGSIAPVVDSDINNETIKESIETSIQDKNKTPKEVKEAPNLALLDALALNPLTITNTIEPIQLLEEIVLEKKKKSEENLIEGKLEAGAFLVVNSTMLLNNETRAGFDQNSLTTNYFGLAANYGLWASYRILPRGALVAEFSINADNRQAYGTYEKGVFYIKEWVMKYNRFSLAYKHDLWQTGSDKLLNTKVVAQVGVYMGMLREAKLFYDGVLFFDKQSDYHQFDFGFKVALGQEILIDKFVLGYGIRSDIGAANIFKGNNQLNGKENQTNIIHLGGYVLFGYRF
jgi:hypothetical protein